MTGIIAVISAQHSASINTAISLIFGAAEASMNCRPLARSAGPLIDNNSFQAGRPKWMIPPPVLQAADWTRIFTISAISPNEQPDRC
jgi:hypothetical protein